ncbi:single-stranded DNA-binding protein [Candidatus Dojkabacteria bacterium]|nr:single-stranded DNA-binding protein [Candidatus Dojkabacteria bacterium]
MFGDLNRVEIIGNVTQDLEVRYTANGAAVTSFGVATNRRWKKQDGDEWQEQVEFHNVVVWGQLAEGLAQRAKKGTRIYIAGRLGTRSWEDKEGKKNYKTEITATEVILLDRYEKGPSANLPEATVNDSSPNEIPEDELEKGAKGKKGKKSEEIDPDDLPF